MADSKLNLDFEDMMEDDKNTITLNSSREVKLNSPLLRGMDLDLSFAASKNSYEQEGIQEQDMNVVFELPDGSQGESRFKMGQTIEVLKSFVESEYGIPMEEQKLYIDNKLLLNPMSLLDYPEAKGIDSTAPVHGMSLNLIHVFVFTLLQQQARTKYLFVWKDTCRLNPRNKLCGARLCVRSFSLASGRIFVKRNPGSPSVS
jgi:hypothetical protein